jgi:hypothetical protein
MRLRSTVSYLLLLVPSFILFAGLWTFAVAGRLHYCWDSAPFGDFIPPFVHSAVDPRDHYIAPAAVVWTVWSAFVIGALTLPLIIRQKFTRSHAVGDATQ